MEAALLRLPQAGAARGKAFEYSTAAPGLDPALVKLQAQPAAGADARRVQVSITESGFSEIETMPSAASQSAKSGWSLGPWPQMPTYLPVARQAAMAREIKALHGRVALVEVVRQLLQPGVAVQAQGELGQVVGADGHAVEVGQELVGQDGVARHLAHHDQAQAVLAALQAAVGQQLAHPLGLAHVVRTKGTMISTLVRPMSLRTRFRASHSMPKASVNSLLM